MSGLSQGTLDGFCGLYSATHLAAVLTGRPTEPFFFELLKALERRRRLTAKRIASTNPDELGFSRGLIKTAFNEIPKSRRFGLSAIAFNQPKFKNSRFRGNASAAFAERCGFIISVSAGQHWVATKEYNGDGQYKCFDPSNDREHSKFAKIFWDDGLMIGPSNVIEAL